MDDHLQYLFELESAFHNTNHLRKTYDNLLSSISKGLYTNPSSLSLTETLAIFSYTSSIGGEFFPRIVNNSIRQKQWENNKFIKEFVAILNLALTRLPGYSGDKYRMLPNEYYDTKDVKKIRKMFDSNLQQSFVVNHFLSTSKDNWENSKMIWRIRSYNNFSAGRDISSISSKPNRPGLGEDEVLFSSNAKFKIVATREVDDYVLVELDELTNNASVALEFGYSLNKI